MAQRATSVHMGSNAAAKKSDTTTPTKQRHAHTGTKRRLARCSRTCSVPTSATKTFKTPFTAMDLNSRDGFLTGVWGPSLWMTLHTISMNYPCNPTAQQKRQFKAFFDGLQHVLPCGKCRDNLVSNLKTTKYSTKVFRNRDSLAKWVYNLHACVNSMLGKNTPLSYEEMRHTFENFRARCGLEQKERSCPPQAQRRSPSAQNGGGGSASRVRESGCTVPVTGIKSKCVLRIVPVGRRTKTFKVHRRCLCKRLKTKSVRVDRKK